MDLLLYETHLPERPLLRGLRPEAGTAPTPRFDWASYVIRLAQAVARREGGRPAA